MSIVFLDGKFLPRAEAFVPIDDRGFLFGDGVFTTIKVADGRLENYGAHRARLESHAAALNMTIPSLDINWINELIIRNEASEGVWRLKIIVTGGAATIRSITPRGHGHLIITMERQLEKLPATYRLVEYPYPITGPTTQLKSLSYLNRLCIIDFATSQGFNDALVLSPEGWMLETAFANIFWRKGTEIYTPDPSLPLLTGISLMTVEKCIKNLGMHWQPIKAKPSSLPSEAQLFITNAMIGIVPVVSYMDRKFARDLNFEKQLLQSYNSTLEMAS